MRTRKTMHELEQVQSVGNALGAMIVAELVKSHKQIVELMRESTVLRCAFTDSVSDAVQLGMLNLNNPVETPLYKEDGSDYPFAS